MITNIVIQIFYLGIPMGNGELPQYIKDHRSIICLDKDPIHATPNEDKLCGLRCLALHLNLKDGGDGYRNMEAGAKKNSSNSGNNVCQTWEKKA